VPKISPVLPAKSNSFVPSGSLPSTTLNDGSFCELEHPVTEMNQAPSVPTFPSASVPGTISHVCACAAGAPNRTGRRGRQGELCVRPDTVGGDGQPSARLITTPSVCSFASAGSDLEDVHLCPPGRAPPLPAPGCSAGSWPNIGPAGPGALVAMA
jgi:hypothetical protein